MIFSILLKICLIIIIFFFLISVVEIKNSTFSSISFFILQLDVSDFTHASFCTGFIKKLLCILKVCSTHAHEIQLSNVTIHLILSWGIPVVYITNNKQIIIPCTVHTSRVRLDDEISTSAAH